MFGFSLPGLDQEIPRAVIKKKRLVHTMEKCNHKTKKPKNQKNKVSRIHFFVALQTAVDADAVFHVPDIAYIS